MINDLSFRDLGYFAAVARSSSLTRAAEGLDLSTPALSKSLRRLERIVGARLVERRPKGVVLTGAGKVLAGSIRRLERSMEDVTREALDAGKGLAGHLRIGLSQVDGYEMTAACAELLRQAPKLTFEVVIGNNQVMVPGVLDGNLDLIINALPVRPFEGTEQVRLHDDEYVICAARRHRLAKRKAVSVHDIANEGWISNVPDGEASRVLHSLFRDAGLPAPRISLEARSIHVRLHMLAASGLLGVTSKRLLEKAAKSFDLVRLPLTGHVWPRPVGVIYRKEGYLPAAATRLLTLLKARFAA